MENGSERSTGKNKVGAGRGVSETIRVFDCTEIYDVELYINASLFTAYCMTKPRR